jgi:predicted metal-dependent phosphotriesterase family hydrolase
VLEEGVKKSLFDTFLPMLRERGVTDEEIREVMELNPRRFFGEEI